MNKKTPAIPKILPKSLTGITGLDEITGGGLPTGRPTLVAGSAYRGSSVLGTGSAGTGKSSIAARVARPRAAAASARSFSSMSSIS